MKLLWLCQRPAVHRANEIRAIFNDQNLLIKRNRLKLNYSISTLVKPATAVLMVEMKRASLVGCVLSRSFFLSMDLSFNKFLKQNGIDGQDGKIIRNSE